MSNTGTISLSNYTEQEKEFFRGLLVLSQFQKALDNLPTIDVTSIKDFLRSKAKDKSDLDKIPKDGELAKQIVTLRWTNKICDNCSYKWDLDRLFLCEKCCLVFYCCKKCQEEHQPVH